MFSNNTLATAAAAIRQMKRLVNQSSLHQRGRALTIVWHHTQRFPVSPWKLLIFFWHRSHFLESQLPLTQSCAGTWTRTRVQNRTRDPVRFGSVVVGVVTATPAHPCFLLGLDVRPGARRRVPVSAAPVDGVLAACEQTSVTI